MSASVERVPEYNRLGSIGASRNNINRSPHQCLQRGYVASSGRGQILDPLYTDGRLLPARHTFVRWVQVVVVFSTTHHRIPLCVDIAHDNSTHIYPVAYVNL